MPRAQRPKVQFDLDAIERHEVQPYAEVYGLHPRHFDFDLGFHMVPALAHGQNAAMEKQRKQRKMSLAGLLAMDSSDRKTISDVDGCGADIDSECDSECDSDCSGSDDEEGCAWVLVRQC